MAKKLDGATFIKGAAILGLASLFSKMLGLIYRIPYQNITGDLGYYVYTQVYPLYGTLLILATAGFPIAISKMVSEKLAVGDLYGVRRVFRVSVITLFFTGIISFLSLYYGAESIAMWMGNDKLTLPIRSVSYALLIVPPMAAMRGYFQGHQNMVPTAISQIAEQFVRVATIIILAYWFMSTTGNEYLAGAGAVFGAFTGALTGLLVLLLFWRKNKQLHKEPQFTQQKMPQESSWQLMKQILYYAIPICFGALVLPLLQLSDSFTVANLLMKAGYPPEEANILKGVFDRGQPLVSFGAFFATALSLSLVPAISEANARRAKQIIQSRTELALRLTLMIGLPTSIGLAVVAEPVNIMLYQNNNGTFTLIVLSFTTIFSTLGITSAGILQGLGKVLLPAKNLLVGVIIKVGLNIMLIPLMGITGAALATVLAYAVATMLNLMAVARYTGVTFQFKRFFLKPIFAVTMMGVMVFLIEQISMNLLFGVIESYRLYFTVVAIIAVVSGAMIFGIALFISGSITRTDLQYIPKAEKFIPLLNKLHLLRD
ncbi:polysaccharide biosynthesis protein [Ammoniphilus sp. CFH 90114]|uniref:putative polysaccharide biosynthesis protein n=1 Tax=Ammoniphilus sp. CFH 90114 TaxID=2493665 RepID=UPI00100FCDD9|nr:polysaccharide biosynthesis protein [Ammoniphilus sp. CFH 90114]RXT09010.1 polysaccharide biosynthesis protein [Ammoniphilus sp. CFH 90114]